MLFTYSDNIAAGKGVVYNPGGERVDGASDLLFALVLAVFRLVGIPVDVGAALLNSLSLGFIVFAVWRAWSHCGFGDKWVPRVAVLVLLITTPVFLLGIAGFGSLFFAALVTLVALLATRLNGATPVAHLLAVGLAVAVAGMDRVEGFLLGGTIVLAHSIATRSLRTLWIPAAAAGCIGIGWFAWRWSYFGWPLPNPFYKKAGLNLGSLRASISSVWFFAAPWLLLLVAGLVSPRSRRFSFSYGIVVVGSWTALWVLLSDELNFAGRFQFPVVPVIAVLTSLVVSLMLDDLMKRSRSSASLPSKTRIVTAALIAVLCLAIAQSLHSISGIERAALKDWGTTSFHRNVAAALNSATGGRGNVATTEAGMVAWKTSLTVTDLWGLNDKRIAHNGLLKPQEIGALKPDVLFSHPGTKEFFGKGIRGTADDSWERMNAYLFCFAKSSGFEPVAVWEDRNRDDLWIVLARGGSALAGRLARELSDVELRGKPPVSAPSHLPTISKCGT